jgi:hypothetical protein
MCKISTMINTLVCVFIAFLFISGCNTPSQSEKLPADNKVSNTLTQEERTTTLSPVEFTDEENQALDAVASDKILEFLGKTFDKDAAEAKYENEKSNPGVNANLNYDESIETKLLVTQFILGENTYNRQLYADSFEFNLDSLINNGLMAIIPRNPYTGEDIKSSLDYSPGNCFLAADERGIIFIYHAGEKEMAFEPNRENNTILAYQKYKNEPENLSDGRSLIHYHKFSPSEYSELVSGGEGMKAGQFKENNNPEFRKFYWLKRQVFEMMSRYGQVNGDVLQSLEDYIDYFGRINPSAWINPYTGQPMEQVGFTADVSVPPDLLDKPQDKSHYAGNYAFVAFTDKIGNGPEAVFAIYYLKPDGDLGALVADEAPRSLR